MYRLDLGVPGSLVKDEPVPPLGALSPSGPLVAPSGAPLGATPLSRGSGGAEQLGLLDLTALEIKKLQRLPPPQSDGVNRRCPHKKTDFRYKMWVKERKVGS